MAKTAAQLVPLKSQLAQNMALFRFADATTDFSGSVAYQDWTYDNSGASNLTPNGFSGASPVSLSGAVLPTTAVSVPTNLTATVNNAAASGLSRYAIQQWYWIAFYDSSNRESQPMVVLATIPLGTTSGSVTFNFTWPAGAAGAAIYKAVGGSGCYRVSLGNQIGTITDTNGLFTTWTSGTGNTSTYATGANTAWFANCTPSPSSASVAPAMSTTYCNVTTASTGGSFRSSAYGYAVSAYNTLGETTITAETDAQITGSALISGGVMTNPTLTGATTSGTLPAGKYYYKVTAYTAQPSINGYVPSQGGGFSETLPSAEVNTTLAANGQITVSWSTVTNAAGYIVYRSNDLVNPTATTTSTATTGGTIAASTQYFYVVTATNANGETMASNEVSQTTGAGTATNTITVNWNKVPNAYGYRVYRGTATGAENTLIGTIASGGTLTFVDTGTAGSAASLPVSNTATGTGQETYIIQVSGGASTSWIDSGLNPNNQNSGFTPPTTYNGQYGPASISLNWNASTGSPVGYNLYRNTYANVNNANSSNYYQVVAPTVTYNDTNLAATGTKFPVQANLTSVQNIVTVGRYLQPPAGIPNTAPNSVITKLGFSFAGVAGKQYRFFIYDQSSNTFRWNSATFTAPSSAMLYYEAQPNLSMTNWVGDFTFFGVQGMDGASSVTWQPNLKASSGDAPNTVQSENGTWIATGANYNLGPAGWNLGGSANSGINSPVAVLNEATTGSLPMKVVFRVFTSGANINGTKGTFLGGTRWPQYALSPNTSYASTPVKSIVPSWSISSPTTPLSNQFYSGRWATVEVSTDGGTTFSALTNNTRFVFPSAATQLQFRYTVPQNSCAMSFDRRIMTGLPASDSAFVGFSNGSFTTDTNNPGYWYQQQGSGSDAFLSSNGNFRLGTSFANWIYNLWSVQGFSPDVDMTTTGYMFGNGNFGLRCRHDGTAGPFGGYYAYIDQAGNAGLLKQTTANVVTTLVTVANATPALLNMYYTLRLIAVGQHFLFFVNGRLVIDYTDATATANFLTGSNVGLSGSNNNNISGFQATALTSTFVTNSPPWELEYVAAYLET